MRRTDKKPYKIIGAYDSETTNLVDKNGKRAFPILHQLGLLDCNIENITADNVENHVSIAMYRRALELFEQLDAIAAMEYDFVPVICCHNLAFDMYGLSPWLNAHNTRVLAKSLRKPITFTICDDNNEPRLVLWDTLVFSQKSLSKMGDECGYRKLDGSWDYNRIRTPSTPLTDDEIAYAEHDIYALIAWLSFWLSKNPDIDPSKLGLNVVTKTGVVREKRIKRFSKIKSKKRGYNLQKLWTLKNVNQQPKTDDELFTMHTSMRGGFTFVSMANASKPFDLRGTDKRVFGYDATSQHPAQMVSHRYPVNFHETSSDALYWAFQAVGRVTLDKMLFDYSKPFGVAFYGAFEFENLRPKKGSVFARFGVYPLASARFGSHDFELDEDNQSGQEFNEFASKIGYQDAALNPTFAFGKLVSAERCILFITELTAWEIWQAYDFDSVKALNGYFTAKFERPTDFCTVSVMQFYQAKNEFKKAREQYFEKGTIDNPDKLLKLGFAESTVKSMVDGTATDNDVDLQYLNTKADLNALFGIEATNEFRRPTELSESGIVNVGEFGLCNAPKVPKAHYQFGQRIVGWSRIAQCIVMMLAAPYVDEIVNGDTDSLKFVATYDNARLIDERLEGFGLAIDKAKDDNCKRVREHISDYYDPLHKIGWYVREFESECFCASWNKAYCRYDIDPRDNIRKYHFTIAGLPSKPINDFANSTGYDFGTVCDLMLGYNVSFTSSLIELNARSFPEWASTVFEQVTDYLGETSLVAEPAALALHPTSKIINSFSSAENVENFKIAVSNRETVNSDHILLYKNGDKYEIFNISGYNNA